MMVAFWAVLEFSQLFGARLVCYIPYDLTRFDD
jgi:hypothetical protein